MKPLTQKALRPLGCGMPDCDHDHSTLFLVGACHPGAGSVVEYTKATGVLSVSCKACDRQIAELMVAKS